MRTWWSKAVAAGNKKVLEEEGKGKDIYWVTSSLASMSSTTVHSSSCGDLRTIKLVFKLISSVIGLGWTTNLKKRECLSLFK